MRFTTINGYPIPPEHHKKWSNNNTASSFHCVSHCTMLFLQQTVHPGDTSRWLCAKSVSSWAAVCGILLSLGSMILLRNRQIYVVSTSLWLVDGWLTHTDVAGCFTIPDTTLIDAFPTVGARAVNGVNGDVLGGLDSGYFKQVPVLRPVQEKPL